MMNSSAYTSLTVKNTTNEKVDVYVTFADKNPESTCCPNPLEVSDFPFLEKLSNLKGKFTLNPSESKDFDPKGGCFSGNIGFYIEPQCPVKNADFHHGKEGTNIAEFTLNPENKCPEAFDISCVNGVNCFIEMSAEENQGWTYGPKNTPISKIQNKALQKNSGNPGVYPVNCTDCIGLINEPPCPSLPIGPAQNERICNIQRPGRGGTLHIKLIEPLII